MLLFPDIRVRSLPGTIRFIQADAREIDFTPFAEAKLVTADPPWRYAGGLFGSAANAKVEQHYETLSFADIGKILARAGREVTAARLAMWAVCPLLPNQSDRMSLEIKPWVYRTAGAWVKVGGGGIGYHWLGAAEIVMIYTNGSRLPNHMKEMGSLHSGFASTDPATDPGHDMVGQDGFVSQPGKHSEKPVEWMRQWLLRWTDENDLVLDIFAGLGPMARACLLTNRRYVGIEMSAERIADAHDQLNLFRTQHGL